MFCLLPIFKNNALFTDETYKGRNMKVYLRILKLNQKEKSKYPF